MYVRIHESAKHHRYIRRLIWERLSLLRAVALVVKQELGLATYATEHFWKHHILGCTKAQNIKIHNGACCGQDLFGADYRCWGRWFRWLVVKQDLQPVSQNMLNSMYVFGMHMSAKHQRYTRQLIWERLLLLRDLANGQEGARSCNLCNKTFRIEHAWECTSVQNINAVSLICMYLSLCICICICPSKTGVMRIGEWFCGICQYDDWMNSEWLVQECLTIAALGNRYVTAYIVVACNMSKTFVKNIG